MPLPRFFQRRITGMRHFISFMHLNPRWVDSMRAAAAQKARYCSIKGGLHPSSRSPVYTPGMRAAAQKARSCSIKGGLHPSSSSPVYAPEHENSCSEGAIL